MADEQIFSSDLLPGEKLIWTGQPDRSAVFVPIDFLLVPFSLVWAGFVIFWFVSVLGMGGFGSSNDGPPIFFALFGIPFVLMGLYFVFGRFIYKDWKKSVTYFALTDQRALIVSKGFSKNLQAVRLDNVPTINKSIRRNGVGTISFGNSSFLVSMYQNTGLEFFGVFYGASPPCFYDIRNAEAVYRQLADRTK